MSAIADQLMNSPVSIGGFTFTYGFVHNRFTYKQWEERNCILSVAKHRPDFIDVRSLPTNAQVELWDAMGTGDVATISRIVRTLDNVVSGL